MHGPRTQQHPSDIQQVILHLLKQHTSMTIAEIASSLDVSYEAVRLQVVQMERDGWVGGSVARGAQRGAAGGAARGAGRPTTRYALTVAGEHQFPKSYDQLAVRLLDTIGERLGADTLHDLLQVITEDLIDKWAPVVAGRPLRERIDLLKDLYAQHDSFMQVVDRPEGVQLVERNCPYLNVASRHTALCSTSVSALARLLGVRVVRVERFQDGDRRCVFRVLADQPIDPTLPAFEYERES